MLDAMKSGYVTALKKLKNPYKDVLKSRQPAKLSSSQVPQMPTIALPDRTNYANIGR
jgi:hypothetical protein